MDSGENRGKENFESQVLHCLNFEKKKKKKKLTSAESNSQSGVVEWK